MVQFNVFSTWAIKQNIDFFPVHALHSVLTARYSKKPAGHWVVFQQIFQELWFWQSAMHRATAALHILCLCVCQQI
jgi:hypothetical protein